MVESVGKDLNLPNSGQWYVITLHLKVVFSSFANGIWYLSGNYKQASPNVGALIQDALYRAEM